MYMRTHACVAHRHVESTQTNVYYVYGTCAAEAEVDILTGDRRIVRTDVAFECGERYV